MAERGILWTLTVLFLFGAAGRWQGPAGMMAELGREPAPAAALGPSEQEDTASELASVLKNLNAEEAATFLSALPEDLAEILVDELPDGQRTAVMERLE